MIDREETRLVPYPAGLMYAVVADVERYPEFLPWVLALRVLKREEGRMVAEMMVGYGGLRERYTSEVSLDPAGRTIDVTQVKGPFKCLENHWRFTPKGEGCEIAFRIRFEFASKLLAKVAGAAFEKAMCKMTEAFEARARALSQLAGESKKD